MYNLKLSLSICLICCVDYKNNNTSHRIKNENSVLLRGICHLVSPHFPPNLLLLHVVEVCRRYERPHSTLPVLTPKYVVEEAGTRLLRWHPSAWLNLNRLAVTSGDAWKDHEQEPEVHRQNLSRDTKHDWCSIWGLGLRVIERNWTVRNGAQGLSKTFSNIIVFLAEGSEA